MRKIFSILGGLILTLTFVTTAHAAAPNWDLNGTWTFNDIWLGTPYVHTMNITSFDPLTGVFSGTGYWNDNPSLTWNVNGVESGNDITLFHLLVTAVAPDVTIDGTGTINPTGTGISGTGYQSNLPGTDPNIEWTAIGTASLITDNDGDGVPNTKDLCPGTTADTDTSWLLPWGTNRWQVMDKPKLGWYQNKPAKKGQLVATYGYDMAYTYGCNGHQIIDLLTAKLNENSMSGHRKFGLSSSVLEEFHWDMADGKLDGIYLMDEVDVPGTNDVGITTSYATENGVNYKLEASGTYRFANWGEYGIADAKFNYRSAAYNGGVPGWVDGSTWPMPYQYYLQVMTNTGINWIEGYNPTHVYTSTFAGDGSPIHFKILDDAYGDNSGSIHVKIFADL